MFSSDSINGISPRWVELALDSFWLPVVADFTQAITGRVAVTLPPGWALATSGTLTRRGATFEAAQTIPLLDVPIAAAPALHRTAGGRTTVVSLPADSLAAPRVARVATACVDLLDGQFGARAPLPPVTVVLAPRGGPGYSRRNYLVVTPTGDTASVPLAHFLCHEVAHVWSSGANSGGPENWINEGFAEFVAGRAVRTLYGDAAHAEIVARWRRNAAGAAAVWTPAATRRPPAPVAYAKAPLLLDGLEARVGRAAMDRFLARVLTARLGTTPEVLAALREVAGADAATWFTAQLAS